MQHRSSFTASLPASTIWEKALRGWLGDLFKYTINLAANFQAENNVPFGMNYINRRMKYNTELCLEINFPYLALLV